MASMEDYLVDIHREMRRRGMPEMDDDTLRTLAQAMSHPEAMQKFQSGEWTASRLVDEVQGALRGMAEAGDITPSGTATQRIRRQLGIPGPQSAAPKPLLPQQMMTSQLRMV